MGLKNTNYKKNKSRKFFFYGSYFFSVLSYKLAICFSNASIFILASESFCFSRSTTAAGAPETNLSFESFFSTEVQRLFL